MPPRESGRRQPPEPTVVPLRGRSGGGGRSAGTAQGGSVQGGTARGGAAQGGVARGGIGEARRYSPRGRTVREAAGSRDPFRPALELVAAPPRPRAAPGTGTKPGRKPPPKKVAAPKKALAPRKPVPKPVPKRAANKAATPRRPVHKPRPKARPAEPVRRLRLGTGLLLVLFLVIAGRLVALQLTDARGYALRGLKDRLAHEVLFAPRGTIYDRGHNVLAQSLEARYVFADPSMIKTKDIARIADALRLQLGIPTSELTPKLTHHLRTDGVEDEFEYLARGVDIEVGDAITALNLPGIGWAATRCAPSPATTWRPT